jgi:hypothetical protein
MNKYFRIQLCGVTIYKNTNKIRANNTDARAILDKYIKVKNIDIANIGKNILENSLNTIKNQMELVEIRTEKNAIFYHGKYSGGTDYKDQNVYILE